MKKLLNRRIAIVAVAVIATVAFFSFKSGDDRNFQIAKNLDIFNAIVKELDMFYVDTIDPNKTIREGIDNMLYTLDPYTEYYPEEDQSELEQMIKTATIIDDSASKAAGIVSLGSTVLLKDVETGDEETYTIVGTTEADPFENRISNESPVGAAILGRKVHDVVITKTPVGELSYEIVEIK